MTLDEFVAELAPLLKAKGYTKSRLCWVKKCDEVSLIFYIQKSQFGKDVWYYNFGVSINALLNEKCPKSFSDCHLWDRIDRSTGTHIWNPGEIAVLSEKWEVRYGSMEKLHSNAIEGKYPEFVKPEVIPYISAWYKK